LIAGNIVEAIYFDALLELSIIILPINSEVAAIVFLGRYASMMYL